MKILVYGINYYPELTGIGKYTGEFAAWLASNGHRVEVITALPYYPEWQVQPPYQAKRWCKEKVQQVSVYRCPLYVPKSLSAAKRMIHEFSFAVSSLVWLLPAMFRKQDVVICISPPFHIALLPLLICKIKRTPFVYHIQDLQVDAARDLGMIKNKLLLQTLTRLEKFILNKSSLVSTISEGMLARIKAKKLSHSRFLLFPNWVDENVIRPMTKAQSLSGELGLPADAKVVLYSGNIGEKQGLELLIEAARELKGVDNLYFLLVGSGGFKSYLQNLAEGYGLTNVKFLPLQPLEKLSQLLATADLHMVLQKRSASDLVMPSKLSGILAAGGCAVVSADPGTTLYRLMNDHQLGIVIEPESLEALVNSISKGLHEDLSVYRNNARNYAARYLAKESVLKSFESEITKMACP